MYRGFYINLDRATDRRTEMERQLEERGLSGRYTRFAAVDGRARGYGSEGTASCGILGCTLSHLGAIKSQLDCEAHLHIIEDDAVIHREVPRVFENFIRHEQLGDWDLFMTDVFLPPDIYLFKYLHQKYQHSRGTGTISFLDIGNWDFAGSASYFVNKKSKAKVLHLMEQFGADAPYDLRIRSLAKNRMLKVYACFPFFSTLSAASDQSTVSDSFDDVLPLSEYRRSFYIEADLEGINRKLLAMRQPAPDLHMQIYLNLVNSLTDPKHNSF